jgi:hypothetical protein
MKISDFHAWGPADWIVAALVGRAILAEAVRVSVLFIGAFGLACTAVFAIGKGRTHD